LSKQPNHKEGRKNDPVKQSMNYMQYTGMAFQIAIMLGIGAFIGQKLDGYFGLEKPLFTALFVLLFLVAALYLVLKDLLRK